MPEAVIHQQQHALRAHTPLCTYHDNAEPVEHTVWPSICKAEWRQLADSEIRISKTTLPSLGPASSILLHASLDSLFVECNRSSQTSFTEENKGAKTEGCSFFAYPPTANPAVNTSMLAPDEYGLRAHGERREQRRTHTLGALASRPLTELSKLKFLFRCFGANRVHA